MVVVGLGFVVAWSGYLLLTYGYCLVKGVEVTITELALPKNRAAAIAALSAPAVPSSSGLGAQQLPSSAGGGPTNTGVPGAKIGSGTLGAGGGATQVGGNNPNIGLF